MLCNFMWLMHYEVVVVIFFDRFTDGISKKAGLFVQQELFKNFYKSLMLFRGSPAVLE